MEIMIVNMLEARSYLKIGKSIRLTEHCVVGWGGDRLCTEQISNKIGAFEKNTRQWTAVSNAAE